MDFFIIDDFRRFFALPNKLLHKNSLLFYLSPIVALLYLF